MLNICGAFLSLHIISFFRFRINTKVCLSYLPSFRIFNGLFLFGFYFFVPFFFIIVLHCYQWLQDISLHYGYCTIFHIIFFLFVTIKVKMNSLSFASEPILTMRQGIKDQISFVLNLSLDCVLSTASRFTITHLIMHNSMVLIFHGSRPNLIRHSAVNRLQSYLDKSLASNHKFFVSLFILY